jgi:branched-chain amino acid transport system ATP-binding protein
MTAVLEVSELSSGYAGVPVVHGIDLTVEAGEVVALLGPNGAGKTTTLLTAAGVLRAIRGDVVLDGRSLLGLRPHQIARLGLALVPEGRGLFRQLTVKENLRLVRSREGGRSQDDVLGMFPLLEGLQARRVGLLSGGEQQMLALAKALLSRPKVVMLDELSHGLAPSVVEGLFPAVRRLARDQGMGVLLVEQHVRLALSFSDRAYVLSRGRVALDGPAEELGKRGDLLEASYLGTPSETAETKPP